MLNRTSSTQVPETKRKIVDAGIGLMRRCGYNATTVDNICASAGVTKGGFFHYFKSKDELAQAALDHFREGKVKEYENAAFQNSAQPLDRVFGRLDFVKETSGDNQHPTKGCLFGMFAQELAFTNPAFRSACHGFFSKIADDFAKDLAAAKAAHVPQANFDPHRLATLYVAIVQGSLMMAKVAGSNEVLEANIEQFRSYLQDLFGLNRRLETVPAETA